MTEPRRSVRRCSWFGHRMKPAVITLPDGETRWGQRCVRCGHDTIPMHIHG